MKEYDFIAIDFETANEQRDSACQIGITTVKDNQIEEVKSWLINPKQPFSGFNVAIHKITEEMVQNRPTFQELWPEIAPYFGNKEYGNFIVAHNATFDINVLLCMLNRYNIDVPPNRFLCSLAIARRTWHQPSYSLPSLCQTFKIRPGRHDAGEDSRACAEILLLAANEKNIDLSKPLKSEHDLSDIENALQVHIGEFDGSGYTPCLCKRKKYKRKYKSGLEKPIIGDNEKRNPDSVFYQKQVVFTGKLSSMIRDEAMQIIADIGGVNQKTVTKDTNFLIVGQQDFRLVGEEGMSTKQKKAVKSISEGQDLEILSEDEFLRSI